MDFIYKSRFLCHLYCWLSQLRYYDFKKEVERRSKLDLFDYKEIAQPLPKCYYEIITDNNCFGIGYLLRKYAGIKKSFCNALIEHGYFFGNYISELEKATFSKVILTFSEGRKKVIEKKLDEKESDPIGPYIHYAPCYYDVDKFKKEKKKLGKVLLVFFSHSSTGVSVSFDLDYMINRINSIRSDFDTVVISIFWSDITPEIEKRVLNEGYKIFSSGHRYDYYFMSRQKTMIELSDVTMSNSVGTHIAYCTYLKKPHWIIRQDIKETALTQKGMANVAIAKRISEEQEASAEIDLLYQTFADYTTSLTENQIEICRKYFGWDYIRTPEEIKKMIE